ncbi:hypothetical protein [uncultured Methanobrevibacter sp.]|uniref:hypothetical protein n=1 Tax=uncultured Methanobrevibacter sp. TaxID=253161 RepID=UPI0025E5EE81|nr:hypothetical protein [uncultured Methanobrevibacter sp.]
MLKIIDCYLNQLLNSKPSPELKTTLHKLITELKHYGYPDIELVDIISIRIMLDYILSNPGLIRPHEAFIKKATLSIADILGDELYVKIEPEIITLEDDFRRNIQVYQKQIDDKLSEELRDLIIEKL